MINSLRKWAPVFWMAIVAYLIYWAASGLKIYDIDISQTIPQTMKIFTIMFTEMDWAYRPDLTIKMIETLQMAILGTLIASLLAVPFGFLAAKNTGKLLNGPGKFILDVIRVFPELILAIVFFRGVGPGPLAGIMALGIHSIGMLGKLYSEAVEAIDRGPTEALISTGANRVQQIWYSIIPQVLPEFASFAIYRFEINSRAATILGVVGAGGIGTPLIFAIQQRAWGRVGIILLAIILVVSVIDLLSSWLRKRLV